MQYSVYVLHDSCSLATTYNNALSKVHTDAHMKMGMCIVCGRQ